MKICEVTGFEKENGHVIGVKISTDEVIPADCVVLALGPWSSKQLVRSFGIPAIEPHKAASIVLEQAQVSAHALFLSYRSGSSSSSSGRAKETDIEFYPRPDGTLYICIVQYSHSK